MEETVPLLPQDGGHGSHAAASHVSTAHPGGVRRPRQPPQTAISAAFQLYNFFFFLRFTSCRGENVQTFAEELLQHFTSFLTEKRYIAVPLLLYYTITKLCVISDCLLC